MRAVACMRVRARTCVYVSIYDSFHTNKQINTYVCINYIHIHIHIHIYSFIRNTPTLSALHVHVCMCLYVYIYDIYYTLVLLRGT